MKLLNFLPAAGWLGMITWLSVTPSVQLPKFELVSSDKFAHAAAYALLSILLMWGISRSGYRIKQWELWTVFLFSTLYGAFMEWVQGTFFPNRFFEYDDMIANACGAFLAIIVVRLKIIT